MSPNGGGGGGAGSQPLSTAVYMEPSWLGTFVYFHNTFFYVNRKRDSIWGRGREGLSVLEKAFYGAWALDNPTTELTLTPLHIANFNSRKRTQNFGSVHLRLYIMYTFLLINSI
jgi:hypothetical protein